MTLASNRPSPAEDAALLARYLDGRPPEAREQLILRYVPLIHFVLNRLGLLPGELGADYEDLVSQGMLGLIEAVDRYDPAYRAQFSTYATMRIRGQIIDRLRASDWLSRAARRQARQVQNAIGELWGVLRREPSDDELAAHLGLDVAAVRQSLLNASRVMLSLDHLGRELDDEAPLYELLADREHAENDDPAEMATRAELRALLAEAIQALPEREQLVLSMYYVEELTLKEIGAVLNISESRVCQLHGRAVLDLRAWLAERGETGQPEAQIELLMENAYV
jgi:RNA polymerase sigma factor for flagellar operon FliA